MRKLELFVTSHCPSCETARRVAGRAQEQFHDLEVTIIDIDQSGTTVPGELFATPSFYLDGRLISLGTPGWETLARAVRRKEP